MLTDSTIYSLILKIQIEGNYLRISHGKRLKINKTKFERGN